MMSNHGLTGNFNRDSNAIAEVMRSVNIGGGREHVMCVKTLDTRLATVQGRGTVLQDSANRLIYFHNLRFPPAQYSRCSLFSSGPHTCGHKINFSQLGIIQTVLQHF